MDRERSASIGKAVKTVKAPKSSPAPAQTPAQDTTLADLARRMDAAEKSIKDFAPVVEALKGYVAATEDMLLSE